jgi:bifunctional non-homologous end joining protein LigD
MARHRSATLHRYDEKRDFSRTPEPAGGEAAAPSEGPGGRFVVQRHRARRLHYDVRLEIDGVLASWAVPKGPTLDPKARHLAVHVEDHPLEYADFEGVIPTGEYGGGDVIVWDRGQWQPAGTDDPARAIADGELHFDLHGQKLAGRFVLIRRDKDRSGKEQWLLLHKRDDHSQPGWDPEAHPESVKSGRTNDEIAAAPPAVWRSDLPADRAEIAQPQGPTPDELAHLDALGAKGTWTLGARTLTLTNLDKVLFPGTKDAPAATKRDLIRYYAQLAPVMLPYLQDRPLNLRRFPNGVDKPGFWHKETPSHAPEWLRRWHNDEADPGETEWYTLVDDPAGLAWLANYGAVEINPWTSRVPAVHEPTYALIDIDPGTRTTFDDVIVLARLYRTALEHVGVVGQPKVTGQRGLQIFVPIGSGYTFDDTRAWVEELSRAVGATVPELVSWKWEKRARKGLARLDYTQNAINKTLVAPYSVRPAPAAPVSVPIEWAELDDDSLRPDGWTIRTAGARVAQAGDPFRALLAVEQRLPSL